MGFSLSFAGVADGCTFDKDIRREKVLLHSVPSLFEEHLVQTTSLSNSGSVSFIKQE